VFFGDAPEQRPDAPRHGGAGTTARDTASDENADEVSQAVDDEAAIAEALQALFADDEAPVDNDATMAHAPGSLSVSADDIDIASVGSAVYGGMLPDIDWGSIDWGSLSFFDAPEGQLPDAPGGGASLSPPPPPPPQAVRTLARFWPRIRNDGECCWLAAIVQMLLRIAHAVPTLRIGPKALADALYGGPTAWADPAATMATLARVLVSERVVPRANGQHDPLGALGGLLGGESGGALADACKIKLVSELTLTGGCACGSGFERLKSDDSYMPSFFAPSGSAKAWTVQARRRMAARARDGFREVRRLPLRC
jgi:hypothetical protein